LQVGGHGFDPRTLHSLSHKTGLGLLPSSNDLNANSVSVNGYMFAGGSLRDTWPTNQPVLDRYAGGFSKRSLYFEAFP
jgi:hypothetical protein